MNNGMRNFEREEPLRPDWGESKWNEASQNVDRQVRMGRDKS